MNTPRGIRNNNPGNIRWGSDWKGLKKDGKQQDPSFCIFETPEYGIRALAKLLRNYQRLYGLNTPYRIISRYAPPTENEPAGENFLTWDDSFGVDVGWYEEVSEPPWSR